MDQMGSLRGFTSLAMIYLTVGLPGTISEYPSNTVQVRIFEKAPRGTFVYQVSVSELLDVTKYRLFSLVHSGPDREKFGLNEGNSLRVEQYPHLSGALDHIYTVNIQARGVESPHEIISELQIHITVSKANTFPPHFEEAPQFEVFRYIQEGTIIGQVQVSDADSEAYNRASVFELSPSHSVPFSISEQTGVIHTTQSLQNAPNTFSLRVTAVNTGSPRLQKSSALKVAIMDIAEPLSLSIEKHNLSHVEACWNPPSQGRVRRYELSLDRKPLTGSRNRKVVKPDPETERQCEVFGLESDQGYMLTVRAMDGPTLGLASRVEFKMDRSRCGQEVCTGRCIFTPDGSSCRCQGHRRNCGYGSRCSECALSDQTLCQCAEGDESCEAECRSGQPCLNNGEMTVDAGGSLACQCVDGYYGNRCELYNPCTEVVCSNGGSCKNLSSSIYQCDCQQGYYGKHCDGFNPCSKRPCRNSGQCTNVSSSDILCDCRHGFYGDLCQRYDPCFVRPCLNNGVCKNISDTSYSCACPPGYYGHSCEVYQPCSSNPCLHGGFCNSVDGHYECHCPRGRFGRKCEHVNLCLDLQPCGDHSVTCHNMTDWDYKCLCQPGWHGENCTRFDPCFDLPCQHGGRCEQISEVTYTCHCQITYYGENCERTNLCASNPCQNGATCRNVSNHDFLCLCRDGYSGDVCEDYDTCRQAQCQNGARCLNTSSTSYTCICPETYIGELCQHYNSCYESPCLNGQCQIDDNGFYSCECDTGYHGINCQRYDPCLSAPCQNRGLCVQNRDRKYACLCEDLYYGEHCENYNSCHSDPCQGGGCMNQPDKRYVCDCPPGRYGLQCDSTDPCSGYPCKFGATCIHLQSHEYRCQCTADRHGIHCKYKKPCAENPCQHGGECIPLRNGEFMCACGENFQGHLCEEETPCMPDKGRLCFNDGKCATRSDGTRACECRQGYHGYRCQGYNPCSQAGLCHNGASCIVVDNGGFLCQCLDGFFGDHCQYHTSCREEGYCSEGATCVQGREIKCYCPPGYTGARCDEDINECLLSPCHKEASCHNQPGSYICTCIYGHKGSDCQTSVKCPTEETHEARGSYTWSESPHGVTFSIQCSTDSPKRYAKRRCQLQEDGTARWSEPDTSECELKINNATHALQTLLRYRNMTSFDNSYDLVKATELLNAVVQHTKTDINVTEEFMEIIDKILSAPSDVIRASQIANRSHDITFIDSSKLRLKPRELCQKCGILELLDWFMSHVHLTDHMTMSIHKSNFELFTKQNTYVEHEEGITFSPRDNPEARIYLPAEVFQRDQSNERVKFIYFKSPKLFHIEHGKAIAGEVHEVLSASVGRTETMNLQNCIEFSLPNMESPRHARCVYWDEMGRFWATYKLRRLTHSGFQTSCCSTHLSYFSVASNPDAAHIRMSEEHLYLSLTSYIGTGCAVLTLAVVFTTYAVFRQLNKLATGQVLIQLSLTLLLLSVTLLLSRQRLHTGALCLTVAIFSHFLFLSALLWVVVLGHTVYEAATRGDVTTTTVYVIKRCLVAYSFPLCCVLIASLLDSSLYLNDLDTCHMTPHIGALYCSLYLAPCGLAILGQVLVTLSLVRAKCCTAKSQGTTGQEGTQKVGSNFWQVYGSVSTMFFLTLSWVLHLTAAATKTLDYTVYFGSAHFITNGIVGCCLCFFFFVMSSPARQSWTKCCRESPLSSRQRIAGKSSVRSRTLSPDSQYALVNTKPKVSKEKTTFHRQRTVHKSPTADFTVPDSPSSKAPPGGRAEHPSPQLRHFDVNQMDFNARTSRV